MKKAGLSVITVFLMLIPILSQTYLGGTYWFPPVYPSGNVSHGSHIAPEAKFLPAKLDSTWIYVRYSEELLLRFRTKHSYDTNDNLSESIYESVNRSGAENNEGFEGVFYRLTFTYDSHGNINEETLYSVTPTGDEYIYYRIVQHFNADANLTEQINYRRDNEIKELIADSREIYEYDANGNIIETTGYGWDQNSNGWTEGSRGIFGYDANGNQIESIGYRWDSDINDFIATDSGVYIYDFNGNQTERINYNWDPNINDWAKGSRYETIYDGDGQKIEGIEYKWYSDSTQWSAITHSQYSYDGNVTEYIWQSHRDVFVYDANQNVIEQIHYQSGEFLYKKTFSYDANGLLTERNEFGDNSSDLIPMVKEIGFWSLPNTSAFTCSEQHQCIIYPNPAYNLITIETDYSDHYSINITTLNGQQVLAGEMEGTSHQIDLSTFQKGIYFITIRSEDFVTTRKIIKL